MDDITQKETTQVKAGPTLGIKQDVSYSSISRDIKDSSLSNKDVAKMILIDRDRLERENYDLKSKVDGLQGVQIENVGLKEKLKTSLSFEVLTTGTIAVGSLMAGAILIVPINWQIVVPGLFFILLGCVAKTVKIK